jgi:putative phage-type endonuclease
VRQRSEAWFRVRCGRITGSRFAHAMAGRRTQAYQGLIEQLVQERLTGCAERTHTNAAMQWGIDYEGHARNWYASSRRVVVREVGFVVHPEFDYVGASPDGLVGTDGLIEIKCPQPKNFNQVVSSGCVPARYRWQIQGQLWVCQKDWLDFTCFYPPERGVIIRAYPDRSDFDVLAERCAEINAEVERRSRSTVPRIRPRAVPLPVTAKRTTENKPNYDLWWIAAAIIIVILYFLGR